MTALVDYLKHLAILKSKAQLLGVEYSTLAAEELADALDDSLRCMSEPPEASLSPPQRKAVRELHDWCVQLRALVRTAVAQASPRRQNDVVTTVRNFLDVIERHRALLG